LKKFDKVLLASDFDGTLKDDNGVITKDVLDAVRYFQENGGFFTLATGRTYQGLRLYDNSVYNAPALFANGALAYDFKSSAPAFFDGIGEEGREVVRRLHKEFPEISIEMYPFNATYAINLTDKTERHFSDQGISFIVTDNPEELPVPWQKVMLGCNEKNTFEVQQFLSENFTETTYLPTTGTFVEVLKKGVNKGSGLLKLADYLGVPHSRTYAAGDGYNDVDMLKAAAGAFVPCNGDKGAIAAATHVVRSNNDGAIAHAIEILDKIY
jgi:Cof subfamily protein (haloacid dehalogenase superfamily)